MLYIVWTLPAGLVICSLASGRVGTPAAAILGLFASLAVALTSAPKAFSVSGAAEALLRGAWIGWIVVPYILGGLLFWQVALRSDAAGTAVAAPLSDVRARRRLLFLACFLIGPFAESATEFGAGIIGTMVLLRKLDLRTVHLLAFSLLSQTMILWGGMGNGAIVAAAFARADPTELMVNASWFQVAFNIFWLPLYWQMAEQAGIGTGWRERINEALWLAAALGVLIAATAALGPEAAMLSAYGPLIVLRYLADNHPDRRMIGQAFSRVAPFTLLIGWLAAARLIPMLTQVLEQAARIVPYVGAPAWYPLLHAGTWLLAGALVTAVLRGQASALPSEFSVAWKTGRLAILTIVIFSMMAEVLSGSGIADSLAQGMFTAFGRWATVPLPLVSALFGALANNGNAANGLFMASQVRLATEGGLNIAAVTALQHVAALSLNMVSPVRMSIVCGLAGVPGLERQAYRTMLPFAAVIVMLIVVSAVLIAARIL